MPTDSFFVRDTGANTAAAFLYTLASDGKPTGCRFSVFGSSDPSEEINSIIIESPDRKIVLVKLSDGFGVVLGPRLSQGGPPLTRKVEDGRFEGIWETARELYRTKVPKKGQEQPAVPARPPESLVGSIVAILEDQYSLDWNYSDKQRISSKLPPGDVSLNLFDRKGETRPPFLSPHLPLI